MILFRLRRYIKITKKINKTLSITRCDKQYETNINLITVLSIAVQSKHFIYLGFKKLHTLYNAISHEIIRIHYYLPNGSRYTFRFFGRNFIKLIYYQNDITELCTEYRKFNGKICAYHRYHYMPYDNDLLKCKYYYAVVYNLRKKYTRFIYEKRHANNLYTKVINKIVLYNPYISKELLDKITDTSIMYQLDPIQKACNVIYLGKHLSKIYVKDPTKNMDKYYVSNTRFDVLDVYSIQFLWQ